MAVLPNVPPIPDANRVIFLTVTSPTSVIPVTFPVFGAQEDITVVVNYQILPASQWTFTSASGTALSILPLPITDGQVTLNTPVSAGTIEILGSWQARQVIQPTAPGISRREFNQTTSTLIAALREVALALSTTPQFVQTDALGDGFYNAQSHLISNIADAQSNQDAVNLETMNTALSTLISTGGISNLLSWSFAGTGALSVFSLATSGVIPTSALCYLVSVNGLIVDQSAYAINATAKTITFTSPPINGGDIQVRLTAFARAIANIASAAQAVAGTDNTTAMTPYDVALALANFQTVFLAATPAFTSAVTGLTAAPGDNTTKLSTTAYVTAAILAAMQAPVPFAITGGLPTIGGTTNANGTVAITAGTATDITGVSTLTWGALTANVATGANPNGYAGGATLPNSATIHAYVMHGTSGYCLWLSNIYATTVAGLTLPGSMAGYSGTMRRVGSFTTTSAGAPVAYTGLEGPGGALNAYFSAVIADANQVTPTTTRTLYTLTVPTGIQVIWQGRYANSYAGVLVSPSEPDYAPSTGLASPGYDGYGGSGTFSSYRQLFTNTSGQIAHRSSSVSGTLEIYTTGFTDPRRS